MDVTGAGRTRMQIFLFGLLAVFVLWSMPATTDAAERAGMPPDPVNLILEMPRHFEPVQDYTTLLLKREDMGGTFARETIFMKFRRPFNVYMKWTEAPHKGRELLFRKGVNDDRLLVHEGGFLGLVNVSLNPLGSMAMKDNHHPVSDAGIGSLTEQVVEGLKRGLERGDVTVTYGGTVGLEEREAHACKVQFPEKREGFIVTAGKGETLWDIAAMTGRDMRVILLSNDGIDDPGDIREGQEVFVPFHYCRRYVIYIDVQWGIPLRIDIYDWGNRLYESYYYSRLRINTGLGDADFDPDNEEYDF